MNNYPIKEKDDLGRIRKTIWNESKTTLKKYWGDTDNIKIIYTIFYGNDTTLDAFDRKGNLIVSYSKTLGIRIQIPGFDLNKSSENGNIRFTIDRDKLNKWKKMIKKN